MTSAGSAQGWDEVPGGLSPECLDGKTVGGTAPAPADPLESAKTAAHRALDAAEKAWYAYAGMLDVGPDRTRAFDVYEKVRLARRV